MFALSVCCCLKTEHLNIPKTSLYYTIYPVLISVVLVHTISCVSTHKIFYPMNYMQEYETGNLKTLSGGV